MGVKPSVAPFRHFFSLQAHSSKQCFGYVSFITLHDGNVLMKVGKNVDDFQRRWIYLDARSHHARLELLAGPSEKLDRWSHENLTDPRVAPVLKKMHADMGSEALTGAMIVREFLTQRLAPLEAHSRPMWDLKGAHDDLRLRRGDLSSDELGKAV